MPYQVSDLQATAPEALLAEEGITVTIWELDSTGFDRVTVEGPTREAVLEYVRTYWGDDDADWFREYVADRIEAVEVSAENGNLSQEWSTAGGVSLLAIIDGEVEREKGLLLLELEEAKNRIEKALADVKADRLIDPMFGVLGDTSRKAEARCATWIAARRRREDIANFYARKAEA